MLVDGNKIAKALEEKLATELLFSSPKKVCFVVFGGSTATEQFVKMKSSVAESVGISVDVKKYPDVKTTDNAVKTLRILCEKDYNGIVVQLPITQGVDTQQVLDAISPLKDIDILGSVAKESYAKGKMDSTPPVAQAVYEILEAHDISLKGKKIVIAGLGRLVGEPVHLMLKRINVPHDVVDIKTSEKEKLSLFKKADIIISGMGVPHSIKLNMIKEGAVLIDAGTSELAGKLLGDIDPECEKVASIMTPVPGGVGPITIVSLLRNLL
ncbi:MAG: hypothetical protein COV32_02460 [Candidatus Yonathbacteria bacterium CG10_big_fil_rev_8_21_14_0_10_43_136]|uniref:Uncharacterized protein n=1 Tax=Candidatus Nomurabacteria bacterium CG2_30_43_9 TaxID=1805283 RepID=A0A1J5G2H0_9BACT|nr:MAG: hypothetical protein AUK15_00230 [Candidatus Nomurabacteria bacterium CG2_30_43_9]PIQ36164.1 MAG: hypothetical protein COW60_00035 [Candidatus Yonathbacteria bacterium CG17_big_fil_post_rev_8_21_14_2_50_43_9]PIR40608.1 MAG: hypothetical protein COV32_02460 [Candidatus Yonathbacteria bacterium CG10_big_fil_rev_8_21_14_0_10_43_136]PIX56837.1 MAG: hypothetical protein COZ48_03710 [Candidatus Yonathbacteria bacterium CG_4_10_14_3_um_filter_43_12]PJC22613.1 MAG: hypothetical protein CO060_00